MDGTFPVGAISCSKADHSGPPTQDYVRCLSTHYYSDMYFVRQTPSVGTPSRLCHTLGCCRAIPMALSSRRQKSSLCSEAPKLQGQLYLGTNRDVEPASSALDLPPSPRVQDIHHSSRSWARLPSPESRMPPPVTIRTSGSAQPSTEISRLSLVLPSMLAPVCLTASKPAYIGKHLNWFPSLLAAHQRS